MRRYSQRSLKSLEGIHLDLRRVIDRALQTSPLDFVVIEGLRTLDRQKELVKRGASRTLNSRHLTGHAVDLVPIGADGELSWHWPDYHQLGPAVELAARDLGVALVWGGRWPKFQDGPHFELDRFAYPADGDKQEPEPQPAQPAQPSGIAGLFAAILRALKGGRG